MQTTAATGSIVLLTRLARLVYRRSTVELVGMGLKELGTLALLRDHDQMTQQGLIEGLCIDANNCVLLLNELEELDYVERRRDPQDRRRHLVKITEDGLAALERAERAQSSVEDDLLVALSAEERSMLHQLLSRALDGQGSGPSPK
ncbi:MAG TPA: MarR family winged helix-turn-helix transcriptional regulator [Acidimicrobiales bacterium]|jgi:DNA-binding MarR family transcriptional regulator|nr:MarR family winged helix-turn-helix transcriptional regulator [Acidimicrobiales bacterium]